MKILFCSNFLYRFGPAISLFRLIDKLNKMEACEISVLSFLDGPLKKNYSESGIEVRIANLYAHNPKNIIELSNLIKKEAPAIVFANTLDSINAVFAANLAGIRSVLYVYEDWEQINTSLLHLFAFKTADLVLFTDKHLKKVYAPLVKGIISRELQEGIPFDAFPAGPDADRIEKIKRSFELPLDKKIVSIIGTVCNRKRQDLLVFAASEILKQRDNVIFLLAGWYRPEEVYFQLLKKYIEAGGLGSKIIFLGDRSDIEDLYQISDLLVCPSSNDTAPVVLLEALAAGKPVIGTDLEGIRERIMNGLDGLLIQNGDQAGLVKAISEILDNLPLFKNNVLEEREELIKKYSIGEKAAELLRVLKQTKKSTKHYKLALRGDQLEFKAKNLELQFGDISPLVSRDFR